MNRKLQSARVRSLAFVLCVCLALGVTACVSSNQEATDAINNSGIPKSYSSVTTPNGSIIETINWGPLPAAEVDGLNAYAEDLISEFRWNVQKLREPTSSYNCHSYAWYQATTGNIHWINLMTETWQANLSKYWTDGSYTLIDTVADGSIPSSVPANARVFYANGDHSAINNANGMFISKWGPAGVYRHAPSHAPYDYSVLEYYEAA
ncbi:MAG: hypothetical protein LBR85_04530 [Oscillospiraceae bacterium]|jgi:hypothetical protein|nr:hypothetical protein [Oscillospiraceae bacterium]